MIAKYMSYAISAVVGITVTAHYTSEMEAWRAAASGLVLMLWTTIGILIILGVYLLVQARENHLERDAQRRAEAEAEAEKLSYGQGRPVPASRRNAARRTHAVRDGRHYDAWGNELNPVTGYLLANALLGNDQIEDQRRSRNPEDIHNILQDVPPGPRDTPHETHEPETPAHTARAHTPDPTPIHTPDPTPADSESSPDGGGGYDDGGGWDSDGGGDW